MLSIANVKNINRQIAAEMRTASSICSSHTEKLEAIERADALRQLLENRYEVPDPRPDRVGRTIDIRRIPMTHLPKFEFKLRAP
jgi:hypothetical protein